MRYRHGYFRSTTELAVVRSLLESPRIRRLDHLLGYRERWSDDRWPFFVTAAMDKRASLSLLVRMDER